MAPHRVTADDFDSLLTETECSGAFLATARQILADIRRAAPSFLADSDTLCQLAQKHSPTWEQLPEADQAEFRTLMATPLFFFTGLCICGDEEDVFHRVFEETQTRLCGARRQRDPDDGDALTAEPEPAFTPPLAEDNPVLWCAECSTREEDFYHENRVLILQRDAPEMKPTHHK